MATLKSRCVKEKKDKQVTFTSAHKYARGGILLKGTCNSCGSKCTKFVKESDVPSSLKIVKHGKGQNSRKSRQSRQSRRSRS